MCFNPEFASTSESRRSNMRAIRSRRNKTTEMRLRAHIVAAGISGWRMHDSSIPGQPDFYFRKKQLAVFVDGCFWHGCPQCGHIPSTNRHYWSAKLAKNRRRDILVSRALRRLGMRVLRVWECQLRENPAKCVTKLVRLLELRTGLRRRTGAAPKG